MNVGIIGLGRMGEALAYRAIKGGFKVFGFDPNASACATAAHSGVHIVENINNFADQDIHIFWLMIPQGNLIDKVIEQLRGIVQQGDIIVDGGNSKFSDSIRRAHELAKDAIHFIDCGTSGGIHGREHGFCLMIGGNKNAYATIEPLLKVIAARDGYAYLGSSGAGHYVKMIHNGIEYGVLQAYAEGFHVLKDGLFKNELDLEKIALLWNHGSVIRSWILDLIYEIMKEDQKLEHINGNIASTGMGLWTVEQAHKSDIPVPVIEESLKVRAWSEKTGGNYATKMVAMLRNKFGGHTVTPLRRDFVGSKTKKIRR